MRYLIRYLMEYVLMKTTETKCDLRNFYCTKETFIFKLSMMFHMTHTTNLGIGNIEVFFLFSVGRVTTKLLLLFLCPTPDRFVGFRTFNCWLEWERALLFTLDTGGAILNENEGSDRIICIGVRAGALRAGWRATVSLLFSSISS